MTASNRLITTARNSALSAENELRLTRRSAMRGLGGAGLAVAGLVLAGGSTSRVAADHMAPAIGPAEVVAGYVEAVNAHDVERILSFYADDAIHVALPTPDGSAGVCQGKSQFRMWYEQSIANGDEIELLEGSLQVAGERATFTIRTTSAPWTALGLGKLEASAEAVIVDGTIRTHVVMLSPGSVRELLSAQGVVPDASHSH